MDYFCIIKVPIAGYDNGLKKFISNLEYHQVDICNALFIFNRFCVTKENLSTPEGTYSRKGIQSETSYWNERHAHSVAENESRKK